MKFIFDLDGTLYNFDDLQGKVFYQSRFYSRIKENIYLFLEKRLAFSKEEITKELEFADKYYNSEYSLYFENKFNISRYDYFNFCFDLDPEEFIKKNNELPKLFEELKGKALILTAAPEKWAKKALNYLDILEYLDINIITGEPNIRKPNPEVFKQALDILKSKPSDTLSIGDQEHSDIIPAKQVGMKTAIIGKSVIADYELKDTSAMIKLVRELNEKNNY
jgi:putative hydrolase of the HAD superfamily